MNPLTLILDHPLLTVATCFAACLAGLAVLAVAPERALHLDLDDEDGAW